MRELERDLTEAAGPAADTTALPRLAIVGRGRVGGAISAALEHSGVEVEAAGRAEAAEASARAEAALLCVGDADIPGACQAVAQHVPPIRFVGHVSGASTLDALSAAAERGAATFSLHPLQTVPNADADLIGSACAVAGSSPAALDYARALADRLGMVAFEVPESSRATYHAAACIASNFLVTLEESASELLSAAGVEDGRELLAPMVRRAAANWAENGADALTGPITRGDESTIERHRAAIAQTAPELAALYDALAERTRTISEKR